MAAICAAPMDMPVSTRFLTRNYVGLVTAVGLLILAQSIWNLVQNPVHWAWYVLLGLTLISGSARLAIPSVPVSTSISDTFTITAALVFGPSAGAIIVALDALVLSYGLPRPARSWIRLLFNPTATAAALWLPANAFFLLAGSSRASGEDISLVGLLTGLLVFACLYFVMNTGLVAVAVALERQESVVRIWREHFFSLWPTHFGGTAVGGTLVYLLRMHEMNLANLAVAVPVPLVLYFMFKHALGRTQDQITHLGEINRLYLATIEALATAIDAKDQVTHGHIRRVQRHTLRLAEKLGIQDENQIKAIEAASLLHDMGKIAVPEHILNKPGRLSPSEFEIMKRHAPIGADILSAIDFPYPVVPVVRHHHENWDGTGYPDGIAGDQIPIGARILQVVDCFDALTSDRPYRRRMTASDAAAILRQRRGTMYDPRIVDAFIDIYSEVDTELASEGIGPLEDGPIIEPAALEPAPAREDEDEVKRLVAAFDLGRALADARGTADLAAILLSHLQTRLTLVVLAIYAHDERSDALVLHEAAGDTMHILTEIRISLGDGVSGWVAANRRSMINADPRLDLGDDAERFSPAALRSCLAVPIIHERDELVGVIAAYASRPNAFAKTHRCLLEAVASRIAPLVSTRPEVGVALAVPLRDSQAQSRTSRPRLP